MPKAFLSYSRLDETFAIRIFEVLKAHGLEVWFDKESLLPGQNWHDEIKKAIKSSDFVVLLLSNHSVAKRGYFQKEIRLTLDVLDTVPFEHIYMLPVRLDDCKVPGPLGSFHYVDIFPDWEAGIRKLMTAIKVQTAIQVSARNAEATPDMVKPRILLVNDEPAGMNLVADIWKSQQFTVEYAFDVASAIQAIQKAPPSVVVSDLSHFSFGNLITDRAGFEILEWARRNGENVKVVITTYNLTEQRRSEAIRLGAIGICNTIPELNSFISQITGQPISLPAGTFKVQ